MASVNLAFFRVLKGPFAAFVADAEEPIRAELFGVERLERHAESLAAAQPVTTRSSGGRRLAARLQENGRFLLDAYRAIAAAIREERSVTPAAEWLVDNFHVVEEQIREIRDDLPRGFYRNCRSLPTGHSRAIRAYSALPGPLSRTLTVGSIRRCSANSCRPTSACSR